MPTDSYQAVLDQLNGKKSILLATHAKPDGDALGSVAAMSLGLRAKGIASRVLLFDPPPEKYAMILQENQIAWFELNQSAGKRNWPADVNPHSFDALLVLDTGTWSQLPGLKELLAEFKSPKIVVDHHLTQEGWADLKLVISDAAAAGEIVADLLKRWGIPIDRPIATTLFLAIATDTGWFQFSNTRPKTMRLAADLMEAGVDTERLYRLAMQNERPQRLALSGRALQSLELLAANRLAVMSLSQFDFQQIAAGPQDTENLVNLPMQVGEVEVSVLIVESPGNEPHRINLRSKGGVDVAAFAQRYQGGGHARAAGLKMTGDLVAARREISQALIAELDRA
ncbi:MAG: bifunctional oligoribonuclease/PAP phosphatase NrnA [Tepidisphaeraceae bacterium]